MCYVIYENINTNAAEVTHNNKNYKHNMNDSYHYWRGGGGAETNVYQIN